MSDRPNIVFIVADQLKPEALSAYGNEIVRTPNIQKMADKGVKFNNFFCNSPLCGPARHSIFTGTYPFSVPLWAQPNCGKINGLKYMGDHFREAGYNTASIGRLHGAPEDFDFGFDYCKFNWEHASFAFNDYGKWFVERLDAHKDRDQVVNRLKEYQDVYPGRMLDGNVFVPRELSEEYWAAEQFDNYLDSYDRDKPFIVHIGLLHPHLPWLTSTVEDEQYDPSDISIPENYCEYSNSARPVLSMLKSVSGKGEKTKDFGESEWRIYASNYYSAVSQVDKCIGSLFEILENRNLADNTIVVLTSDHGEQLGSYGFDQKETLYDAALKIPLIICGKGIPQGEIRDCLAEQVDILPTLLELAGITPPEGLEGVSQSRMITTGDGKPKDAVYAWFAFKNLIQASVRTGEYKLYTCGRQSPEDAIELFDLINDPQEINNIWGSVEYEKIRGLVEKYKVFLEKHGGVIACSIKLCSSLNVQSGFDRSPLFS